MNRALRLYDPILFWLAFAASALGVLFIFDSGYARALRDGKGIIFPEFKSQLMFLAISLVATFMLARVPREGWRRASKLVWLLSLASLVAVALVGLELNGAKRWLALGPISIQPAEFAKVAVIVYLAGVLADRKAWPARVKRFKSFAAWADAVMVPKLKRCLPALWVLFAFLLIAEEPDLGTAAAVLATAGAMFFIGGVSKKSLAIGFVLAIVGAGILVMKEPYRMERFENHSHRWSPQIVDDVGFQTTQSEVAMASGGLTGVGIGAGRAKHVLPATTTDFIMATVAEETGLLGSLAVLGVLGGLAARLMFLARRSGDRFAMLVLSGTAAWIGIQTCTNVMMANGFLPPIGIPLPFLSSGGSSLVALWVAMGICQAVLAPAPAKRGQEEKEERVAADRHGWRDRRAYLSGA
jgi:cell division protein FtsW